MKTTPEDFSHTVGHKISLMSNYDSGEDFTIFTHPDGKMSELYDLGRDGYIFLGWNTNADGSGDTIYSDSVIEEDMTLYAEWVIIPLAPDTGFSHLQRTS